jgi:aldose 1-epimerase
MTPGVDVAGFGRLPDGTPVRRFTLQNGTGVIARVIDYGTTITELHVPDRAGRLADVVLGFDNLAQYLAGPHYLGCTIGRVANRIAAGRFTLNGKVHTLARNNGPNHLHGGIRGFDKAVWRGEPFAGPVAGARFTHVSPDGDEGYPGRLDVGVIVMLTDADELVIDYSATTDQPTPVNLTNHSYFNLAAMGNILGHELTLAAEAYTPTDATLIPTGEIRPVQGTPLDFTRPMSMGARLDQLDGEPRGYDHNFVVDHRGGLTPAARVFEPGTGRVMEVTTSEPGLQLYTANYLDGTQTGKRGQRYSRYAGFTLEAQHFPDAVNQPAFPSTILRPGQTYHQTTVYRFSTA